MIRKTASGLFVREDKGLGVLVYSPFTGLIFRCIENASTKKILLNWLDRNDASAPSDDYAASLGVGWHLPISDAQYPRRNILSVNGQKKALMPAEKPIVINWFLTGQCTYKCVYCYARDVMKTAGDEPTPSDVKKIAKNILSFKPLAVVLTGGDPLCSPNLESAIEVLHNKTGIIVDTNGSLISKRHLRLFKKYNVFVRLSIDSERPKINQQLRPSQIKDEITLISALKCLSLCLKNNIPVGVQTVLTSKNLSDIIPLRQTLSKFRIPTWRILFLVNHSDFANYELLKPNDERFYKQLVDELYKGIDNKMSIQVLHTQPDAVVLVSPTGIFLTEKAGVGKIILDKKNPMKPSFACINNTIDRFAHLDRYLNLSEMPYIYVGKKTRPL